MSTSMRPRTADLRAEKTSIAVTKRSTSGKPRAQTQQEIPREHRTAMWQKRGTRSSRDPAERRLLRAERPATRTEDRSQERTTVRTDDKGPIAFLAQRISECAIH